MENDIEKTENKKLSTPKEIKKSVTVWGKIHGKLSSAIGAAISRKIEPNTEMTEKVFFAMVEDYRRETTFKRG